MVLVWAVVWSITGADCLPGGNLFGILFLYFFAVIGGKIFGFIKIRTLPPLPALLGKISFLLFFLHILCCLKHQVVAAWWTCLDWEQINCVTLKICSFSKLLFLVLSEKVQSSPDWLRRNSNKGSLLNSLWVRELYTYRLKVYCPSDPSVTVP